MQGRIYGEGAGGAHPPPPEMTCGFLIQLIFCKKMSVTPFLTGAPPPKKDILDPPLLWMFSLEVLDQTVEQ